MTTLKRSIEFCFSPIGLLTLLLASSVLLAAIRKVAHIGRRMGGVGVALFVLFLFTPLAELLVARLERPFPPAAMADSNAGIRFVVVLSGYGEGTPGLPVTSRLWPDCAARVVEGIRLYRQRPSSKLLMSGGVLRDGDPPVALLMADYAVALGIPRDDIVLEQTSRTTYENLVEAKKVVGTERFVLVTSACDLWRATAVARKLGMGPVPAPAAIRAVQRYPAGQSWSEWGRAVVDAVGPSPARFEALQRASHEYLGFVWYWLRGRV